MNLSILKKYEGCRLNAYPDPGSGNLPITIGWGSTLYADGKPIKMGDTITQKQADDLLEHTIQSYINCVKKAVKQPLNENQISALTTLCYNIGCYNFTKSTLVKYININLNHPDIDTEWLKWNKSSGKVMKGLQLRRADELKLYKQ